MLTLSAPRARRILGGARRTLWDLRAALALIRERRALAALDEARLADIGITRAEAEAEARRPFWDAPAHWHR